MVNNLVENSPVCVHTKLHTAYEDEINTLYKITLDDTPIRIDIQVPVTNGSYSTTTSNPMPTESEEMPPVSLVKPNKSYTEMPMAGIPCDYRFNKYASDAEGPSPPSAEESIHLVRETEQPPSRPTDDFILEEEMGDTFGDLNATFPQFSRTKPSQKRLSILSMASSITAMAPFIRSRPGDSNEPSPEEYSYASAAIDENDVKVEEGPSKASTATGKPRIWTSSKSTNGLSDIERLSQLMQRAVLNAKKKRNLGIAEQTIEEWSSSLESCFESIPQDNMEFEVPHVMSEHDEVHSNLRKGFKSFSVLQPGTWNRLSRVFFGTTEPKPDFIESSNVPNNTPVNSENTSYLHPNAKYNSFTSGRDADFYTLTAHSVPPSLTATATDSISEPSIGCQTIGGASGSMGRHDRTDMLTETKHKNKRRWVARFFKSIFGSPVS